MSQANVEKLIALSGRDDRLRNRLEQICADPEALSPEWIAEKVAAVGDEYSLPFAPQAFIDYINRQPGGELSDGDLDSIVGGIDRWAASRLLPDLFRFPFGYSGVGGLGGLSGMGGFGVPRG